MVGEVVCVEFVFKHVAAKYLLDVVGTIMALGCLSLLAVKVGGTGFALSFDVIKALLGAVVLDVVAEIWREFPEVVPLPAAERYLLDVF